MPSAPAKKPTAPKTARKTPARAAANPAPKAAAAKAAEAGDKPAKIAPSEPTAGATLRLAGLVARVAQATGAKGKDIRPTVEATLKELGKSLDVGEMLILPPLGKLRITPAKAEGATGPMKLKLRRGAGLGAKKKQAKEALAEGGEAS